MIELRVLGMTCGHCEQAVRAELSRVPGVHDITIELVPGGVSIVRCESDAPHAQLNEAIAEAGYDLAD